MSRILSKPGTIIFVGSYIFCACCSIARSADFELSGRSTFENFKPNGSKYKTFTGRFSVRKSNEKWLIECSLDHVPTTQEVMFDGEDVFTVTRNIVVDEKEIAKNFPGTEKDYIHANTIAYAKSPSASVYSGDYPVGAKPITRLLWFAFLSGPTLSKPGPSNIPAPWGAAYLPESRSFNLSVEWPESNSGFPLRARFVTSTELWTNSFRQWKFSRPVTKSSPFEDKVVAGAYEVTRWTNVDNGKEALALPLTFALERYYPPQANSKAPVSERYLCEVTKIQIKRPVINPIGIEGEVGVLDFRFMNKALPWFYVGYAITNGIWKTTNDPIVTNLIGPFKTQFLRAASSPGYMKARGAPPSKTIARVVCVLVMLCGSIAMLLYWIRNRTKQTIE